MAIKNDINISVGADLGSLKRDLNDAAGVVSASSNTMSKSAQVAGSSFGELTTKLKVLEREQRATISAAQKLAETQGFQAAATQEAISAIDAQRVKINDLKATLSGVGTASMPVQKAAGSFNMLGNSINQLTREMPAFTYSVQTGFMALSNNIPMFVDQIQAIKRANVELAASGQPVQSVFKQVTSALLSWNTALSLGITLLTVFSPKLMEMVSGTTQSAEEIKKSADALKKLNEEIDTYIRTDIENAIFKENEQHKKVVEGISKQIKVQEYYLDVVNRRMVAVGELTKEEIARNEELKGKLQKAELAHQKHLEDIKDRFAKKDKAKKAERAKQEIDVYPMPEFVQPEFNIPKLGMGKQPRMFGELEKELPKLDQTKYALLGLSLAAKDAQERVHGAYLGVVGFSKATFDFSDDIIYFGDILDELGEKVGGWEQLMTNAFVGVGQAIGTAMVSGADDGAKAILEILGGIAQQVGAGLIAIGLGLQASIVGVKPGIAATAAGLGLVILGSMMSSGSFSGGAPSFSSGGGGGGGMNMQSNQPMFNFTPTASTLNFNGLVRGNELVIVTNNQNQINKRTR